MNKKLVILFKITVSPNVFKQILVDLFGTLGKSHLINVTSFIYMHYIKLLWQLFEDSWYL